MRETIKKGIFVVFIIGIVIVVIKTLYTMYINKTNESFDEQSASSTVDTKPSQVKVNNKLSDLIATICVPPAFTAIQDVPAVTPSAPYAPTCTGEE